MADTTYEIHYLYDDETLEVLVLSRRRYNLSEAITCLTSECGQVLKRQTQEPKPNPRLCELQLRWNHKPLISLRVSIDFDLLP